LKRFESTKKGEMPRSNSILKINLYRKQVLEVDAGGKYVRSLTDYTSVAFFHRGILSKEFFRNILYIDCRIAERIMIQNHLYEIDSNR